MKLNKELLAGLAKGHLLTAIGAGMGSGLGSIVKGVKSLDVHSRNQGGLGLNITSSPPASRAGERLENGTVDR